MGYRGYLAAALCALLLLTGCANDYHVHDPMEPFNSAVSSGDEALAGGYVYGAWQWYKASLACDTAVDPDGRIAANAERARRLYRARQELSRPNAPEAFRSPALVLSQFAVAETETVRARQRVLDGMTIVRDALYTEWTDADAGVGGARPGPWTSMVARTTGREWNAALRPVPGPLGERLRAAATSLNEAASTLQRAKATRDTAGSRALVVAAGRAIDRATSAMSAASSTAPTLLVLDGTDRYAGYVADNGRPQEFLRN